MSTGRTKPAVSEDYIVGLTDGEGCFYVNVGESSLYRAGYYVQMHFHIKLQESDKLLLQKVCKKLECGNVYFQKEQRVNHTQCYRYTVSSQNDIFKFIIPFFTKHSLQTCSKQKSFTIFCQIAELVKRKQHLTSKGIEKIRALKSNMNKRTVGLA